MGVSALFKLLMGDGLCSKEFTKSQFGVKQVTKWCRHLCSIFIAAITLFSHVGLLSF